LTRHIAILTVEYQNQLLATFLLIQERFHLRFYLMLLIVITLLAFAFIFGSQNPQTITLNYLIARSELSVAQAVSIFTIIGIVIGILVTLMWRLSRTFKSKRKQATRTTSDKVST